MSPVWIRSATQPGRYADGNGLYLVIDPSGGKRWVLRTVVHGRRRDIGLGGLRVVPLAEAREKAAALRKMARAGGDPLAERRRERRTVPTFEEAARQVHEAQRNSWKNGKHAAQWLNTLAQYAFPTLGGLRVDAIDTPDILKALAPVWLTRPETARRVRQRIGVVLDWATAAGFRTGENPVNGVSKGLPRQTDRNQHHVALPYAKVAAFVAELRDAEVGPAVRLALEFLILTAARTSEVLLTTWDEFDLAENLWNIPAHRMKAGRAHRVPLAPRCLEILAEARRLSDGTGFVFPGRSAGKPLSNMVFLMALRRMQRDITIHGFRSSFCDWASERTNFSREVCEMALAHTLKDKTEAAYRRSDLLERRRELMGSWAAYATAGSGTVIPLRTGAGL